jgi:hypothetical protein
MTLEVFVLFMLGMALELVWLWEAAHTHGQEQVETASVAQMLPDTWFIQAGLIILAGMAFGIVHLLRVDQVYTSLDDAPVFILFTLIGLYVLFAGVIGSQLLPPIHERSVLSTQLLMAAGMLTGAGQLPSAVLWALGSVMLVLSLFLLLYRQALPPIPKALVYAWYLALLLGLSVMNSDTALFSARDLDLTSGFTFGVVFIFLLLHGLFFIRFFLIVCSLILPRNRKYIGEMMPRLFSDEQAEPGLFVLVTLGLIAAVWLNAHFNLLPGALFTSLCVLISTQLLARPWKSNNLRPV